MRRDDDVLKNGASEGIRTLDIHVGNVTLYQTELRSLPTKFENLRERDRIASAFMKLSSAFGKRLV